MTIIESGLPETRIVCTEHGGEIIILNPAIEVFARLLSPFVHESLLKSLTCDAKAKDSQTPCRPVRIKLDD